MAFSWEEIKHEKDFKTYWFRGGFPDSLLAVNDRISNLWCKNYIRTFFTKDILDISSGITAFQVERLYSMLAHVHGQELNLSKIAKSLDLSFTTVRKYIDLLMGAFQLSLVPAFRNNTAKRLVKSPKLYLADTGLLHALLNIQSMNELLGHPVYGYSFEGLVLRNIINHFKDWEYSFYKSAQGAELDLVLQKGTRKIGIEIKASNQPVLTKGTYIAIEDIQPDLVWIVTPSSDEFLLKIKLG
ncbi:MAG: DUF4143 domain-containing protein [Saprospiraceae bacterium]|nr:DUF4143 domain-containing protein [Saprospiraceae bacterium]